MISDDSQKKSDKPEKLESKQKGRPRKSKKVLELLGEEEDLFEKLSKLEEKNTNPVVLTTFWSRIKIHKTGYDQFQDCCKDMISK